ncbi:unnamed protein product [Choristocarpus tenellus]
MIDPYYFHQENGVVIGEGEGADMIPEDKDQTRWEGVGGELSHDHAVIGHGQLGVDGLRQKDLGDEDLDRMLQSNVLDALVDLDFSQAELDGIVHRSSPAEGRGRKRSLSFGWEDAEQPLESTHEAQSKVGQGMATMSDHMLGLEGREMSAEPQIAGTGDRKDGKGKRVLKPERMERKAIREKRRREEVNTKFEQLLVVLKAAEALAGMAPSSHDPNSVTPSSSAMRRVEMLSRTIAVLKKFMAKQRSSCSSQQTPETQIVGKELVAAHHTNVSVAPAPATSQGWSAPSGTVTTQPTVAAGTPSAPGVTSYHPSPSRMPGLQGQPFFIAVPMFMPNPAGVVSSAACSAPIGTVTPNVVSRVEKNTPVPALMTGFSPSPPRKASIPAGSKHGGMNLSGAAAAVAAGFPPMMPVPMPQFAAQALTSDGDDEEPTHAVCA